MQIIAHSLNFCLIMRFILLASSKQTEHSDQRHLTSSCCLQFYFDFPHILNWNFCVGLFVCLEFVPLSSATKTELNTDNKSHFIHSRCVILVCLCSHSIHLSLSYSLI